MRVNSEAVSIVIDESDSQSEKHDEQRNWTWRGIVIDSREEHDENAYDLMHVNSESVSNEIDENDLHSKKHDE
jgi:hypothetical protein